MDRVVSPKQHHRRVASNVQSKENKTSLPSPSTADIGANGTSGYGTASALELEVRNVIYVQCHAGCCPDVHAAAPPAPRPSSHVCILTR